jgi:IclR family acetate operon transcriptional repressor
VNSGLNVSTCHHILATLISRNYVVQGSSRGTYALGPQILTLSSAVNWQSNLPRRAEPFLDHLNRVTGEAVHLAALQGGDLVTLVKREALHALRVDVGSIGKSAACHATATGKSILAWLPEEEVMRILTNQGLRAFTPNTITKPKALLEELRIVRENGYSTDREEFQAYVICIGAPILDHNGGVVGAISVSTPTVRANETHLDLVRREVIAATRELSSGSARPAVR